MLLSRRCLHIFQLLLCSLILAPSAMAQGECNRQPNWDWTVDQYYTMYSIYGTFYNVRLPYYDYFGPASVLNKGSNTDIWANDGWVLVFRDFGLPQCPARTPLFILYNKYRGVLRVFYLNVNGDSTFTHGIGYLTQTNSYKAAAFFPFGKKDYYLNDYDEATVESTIHEVAYGQWSYADFNVVGYDPSLAQDATFNFEFRGVNESNITLDGDLTLDQVMSQNGNVGSKMSFGSISSSISKGYEWYKAADNAKNSLQKIKNNNSNAWYASAIGTILSSGISGMAGPLAGIAGVVSSFITGGKSSQTLPMKFTGSLELTGTMTNSGLLFTFEMRAPGAPLSNANDSKRPDYTTPLGIYNVVSKPSFRYQMVSYCPLTEDGGDSDQTIWVDQTETLYKLYGPEILELEDGNLTVEEEQEILDFIREDFNLQVASGLIPTGGGGGGGGGSCDVTLRFKLTTQLQLVTNPAISSRVSYTMGVIPGNTNVYYISPSTYYNSSFTSSTAGNTNTWALKVRVNTYNSGEPAVYLVNTYDGYFIYGYF